MKLLGGRGVAAGGGAPDDLLDGVPESEVILQDVTDQETGEGTEALEGAGLGEAQQQLDTIELSKQSGGTVGIREEREQRLVRYLAWLKVLVSLRQSRSIALRASGSTGTLIRPTAARNRASDWPFDSPEHLKAEQSTN